MFQSETLPPPKSVSSPSAVFALGTLGAPPPAARTSDRAEPVLDVERFAMITDGEGDRGAELAALLVVNLRSRAAELREMDLVDQARCARVAHAIRGIALNFGAPRLASASLALELVARASCAGEGDLGLVIEEIAFVRQEVASWLDLH